MPRFIRQLARCAVYARLVPAFLLLACFAFVGFALGRTQQRYESTIVRFESRDCSKNDFAGTSLNIGGVRVVSKGSDELVDLIPGDYMVSNLQEPGRPNAKLVAVRVMLGNRLIREYPANENGMANIALDESLFGQSGMRQVIDIITANDCDTGTGSTVEATPVEKTVGVFLKSLGCEKESYRGYTVLFNHQSVTPDDKGVALNVPLHNGRYRLEVSAPGFAGAKIASVTVYRPADNAPYLRKDPNSLGFVEEVILDDDLWDGATATKIPAIFLYITGDCSTTSYEPPMQRLGGPPQIRVVAVEGKVTSYKDDNPDAETQITKDSMIEDGHVVYTRPGARVELVASDKRLFILGGKTVVKFVIKTVMGGAWVVSADIRASEQFTVRHVGYVKGEGGYEWKVLTPTATVTEKGTVYNVIFEPTSKVTTVGVEQGQVLVTPSNSALKPFTLNESQQADVFASRISAIAPYAAPGAWGGALLWVGVGVAGLFVLLVLPIGSYLIYKAFWRDSPKPAYARASSKAVSSTPHAPPAKDASAGVRCPNPACGRVARPGRQLCGKCGTRLR